MRDFGPVAKIIILVVVVVFAWMLLELMMPLFLLGGALYIGYLAARKLGWITGGSYPSERGGRGRR